VLFKVAWRNIWRNTTRSLVVIASVAAGLLAGMFMIAFFQGFVKQDVNNAVEAQLAHIQIHNPAFGDDKDVNDTIVNASGIIEQLRKDVNVKSVSGRAITMGMISSSSTASGVEIHGVNPGDEKNISSISQNVIEGIYFDGKRNEIVIGEKLADKLGVKLHNKIVLTFQSKSGDLTAGSFRIAGIFRSRNSAFDEMTVFTNFDDIAQLLGTSNGIHEIAILLKDGQKADTVAAVYKSQYPKLLVQTWGEIEPEMGLLTGLMDQMMYIIMGIILLALMFGIINTMLMAVLERQREFGMLMAIGMNKPRVFIMVMLESIMLTCVGIPIGILLTIGIVNYFAKYGINMSAFSKALSQFGVGNYVYPELHSSMFLSVTIMTAITAILSAIYPAYKALQFKPAVAIHQI
jgi:putative ABC transport system permease protein